MSKAVKAKVIKMTSLVQVQRQKNPLTYPHEGVLDSLHAFPISTEPIVVDTCEVTLFDLKQLDINADEADI